jgi:hypothetical protein
VARPEQAEEVVAEIRDEGGTPYAYKPAQARRRVLLLKKGRQLPGDGSTPAPVGSPQFTAADCTSLGPARAVAHSSPDSVATRDDNTMRGDNVS